MTNKLTINYDNPALIQSKVSFSFFLKSVVSTGCYGQSRGISVGYSWPNNLGLRTNSKLIPVGHFMQVERERVK